MVTYTIKTGDVLLCDIDAIQTGAGVGSTINLLARNAASPTTALTSGFLFNFHPGENVVKQLDKTIYVIKKPGIPTMYEIGLGERLFNVTTTIKGPNPMDTADYTSTSEFHSLIDLNYLANYQYARVGSRGTFASKKTMGILNFYYYGDGVYPYFIQVAVKNLWYEQVGGGGKKFDIRIGLTQVDIPG